MTQPGVLERIAAALETIADALTGQPTTPARRRRTTPDAQFEWEPAAGVEIPSAPLPEPAPPEERCGFLIEQFTHPLDRATRIYQVSKAGVTEVLKPGEAEELAAMDDDQFAAVMAGRLAAVLAARHAETRTAPPEVTAQEPTDDAAEPEDDDERREREWARTIARDSQ